MILCSGGSLDIENYEGIMKFKKETGAASVMVARSAMWNPSVFRKEGLLPLDDVIQEYLRFVILSFEQHDQEYAKCF